MCPKSFGLQAFELESKDFLNMAQKFTPICLLTLSRRSFGFAERSVKVGGRARTCEVDNKFFIAAITPSLDIAQNSFEST